MLTNFAVGTTYSDQVGVQSFVTVYPASVTLAPSGDVVQVSGTVGDYAAFGVSFGACVDASAYAGLSFALGGSVGPVGTLLLSVYTREDSPEPPFTATGTCVPQDPANPFADCRQAYMTLSVSPTAQPTTVRFADFLGGMPASNAEPTQMLSIWFSLPWGPTAQPYAVDLTLGNVALVH